jgi:hypothetical protein
MISMFVNSQAPKLKRTVITSHPRKTYIKAQVFTNIVQYNKRSA